MSSTDTPFRIVIFNAAGTAIGETSAATRLQNTSSLDKIGSCTISIPAAEPAVQLITPGTYLDCYDEQDGYIGRFYFKSRDLQDGATNATMSLQCDDNLTALQRQFVGYRRKYSFVPVDQVVADLLAIAGWTGSIDTGIGNTTVEYEGESVWAAIDVMRDRWYQHFRVGVAANVLEFGDFGQDSGVLLQNLEGQMQALFEMNTSVAHVSSIKENISTDTLYNRIIPTGGGQGSEAEITIQNAVGGMYAIHTGVNQNGTLYYYIQDDLSVATYGVRTKVVKFPSIKPIANNATDKQRAVEMTKIAAEAYLRQHKDPIYTYSVDVIGLRQAVKVGDLIRLAYRSQQIRGISYLNVDDMMYLMDIRYNRDAGGSRQTSLTLCTSNQRRTSDTDVLVDVVRDISVLKLHVQPYPYWSENTFLDTIQGSSNPLDRTFKAAQFKLEIDNSVMKVTKVRVRFKSLPLYTTMYFNGSFATAIADAYYDVVNSTNYPYTVSMFINGVDVTSALGGPWGLTNAAFDVTADITDYINNAVGGIYQDHLIEFRATNRTGDAAVGNPPTINQTNSNGFIQCNIRVQGVTQGIVPT